MGRFSFHRSINAGIIPLVFLSAALTSHAQEPSRVTQGWDVGPLQRAALVGIDGSPPTQRPATPPAQRPNPHPNQHPDPPPPQVVTVVHRLTGLNVFRLLRRSAASVSVVAPFNREFWPALAVHTSIAAGLVLGNGDTIATYLPQAEAEVETPIIEPVPGLPVQIDARTSRTAPPSHPANTERQDDAPRASIWAGGESGGAGPRGGSSDMMIMRGDGSKAGAKFIGLDEMTGLSFLRVDSPKVNQPAHATDGSFSVGQRIYLFAPERAVRSQSDSAPGVTVRIGEMEAKLARVTHSVSGEITRLVITAPHLSSEIVGGIAINDKGETVGVITSCNDGEARVLSARTVLLAAERVKSRRAAFHRPLLGIQGEALASLASARLVSEGWNPVQALGLVKSREGILLTAVLPGTPAALADLRPGDIITRVNEDIVKTAADLSGRLAEAASERSVNLTILRSQLIRPLSATAAYKGVKPTDPTPPIPPLPPAPFAVDVDLASGSVGSAPVPKLNRDKEPFVNDLENHGVEALSLSRGAAARLGAKGGVLVLFVQPGSEAAHAGLEPGDIIESVNGRVIAVWDQKENSSKIDGSELSLAILRDGIQVSLKLSFASPAP